MGGRLVGVDVGGADQIVEMPRQRADRLGGVQHEIHVADIDRRAVGPEDRVGHRIAQRCRHRGTAGRSGRDRRAVSAMWASCSRRCSARKAAPDAVAAREDLERVARHADLHVGLRPAVVVDAVLRLAGLALAAAVGNVGLVVDQRLGAQQVGQAGRHVADLGAGGLGVPAGEQRAVEIARAFLDLQAGADFAGHALVLAEAEQPVERHLVLGGDVEQRFGARQAGRRARQQLRQRRTVDADRRREGRLVEVGTLQQRLQPLAKQVREIPLVHSGSLQR